MNTNSNIQLQSMNTATSMCLTVIDNDDFAGLVYRNCTNGNLNQNFVMKKNDGRLVSGKIHANIQQDLKYCLQMAKSSPLENNKPPVYIHSDCDDTWEVLESGALKNVGKDKCLGRYSSSLRAVGVECDSDDVEHWLAIDSRYKLFNLHFRTDFRTESSSPGPFVIDGHGAIPAQCHNESNAECDLQLYGMDTFTITPSNSDTWKFSIIGDIYFPSKVDNPFPMTLETEESDPFPLQVYDSDECFDVRIKTLRPSSNETENFEVDGYGYVPIDCYSKKGSECNIHVCGMRTLVLRAYTVHEWQFEVSGDVGGLREYKTAPQGTHKAEAATMDIDEYDYIQVYDLISYSSCLYRAVMAGECETNSTYMLENCARTCNLINLVSPFKKISLDRNLIDDIIWSARLLRSLIVYQFVSLDSTMGQIFNYQAQGCLQCV